MRKLLALSLLLPLSASAQTVINYEDGSIYTLATAKKSTLAMKVARCLSARL